MQRHTATPRPGFEEIVAEQGIIFGTDSLGDQQYWRENAYYSFTAAEIEYLSESTQTLFDMCVEAGDYIVKSPHLLRQFGIPDFAIDVVRSTWDAEPAFGSVYGRMDIRYGGAENVDESLRVPKLYEFNADTPTSILEAAYVQWEWANDTGVGKDQWNAIWDHLVTAWRRNLEPVTAALGKDPTVYFSATNAEMTGEDIVSVYTLLEACEHAGYYTKFIFLEHIHLMDNKFYDEEGNHIDVIFKLHPWEDVVHDAFGEAVIESIRRGIGEGTLWIEPPYKMLWSTKALLPVLWKLYGDDPARSQFLLPAYFPQEAPAGFTTYAKKPFFGREGSNISLHRDGTIVDRIPGDLDETQFVLQQLAEPAEFDGHFATLGVWLIDGEPAGMGIRENDRPITHGNSPFVPHVISDGPDAFANPERSARFDKPDTSPSAGASNSLLDLSALHSRMS